MKGKLLTTAVLLLLATAFHSAVSAQSSRQREYVTVQIVPSRSDWNYSVGEKVEFTLSVMVDNHALKDAVVKYGWGPDMLAPVVSGTINTGSGTKTISMKGMNKPGFMTLNTSTEHQGRTYSNYLTVAFEPEKIVPQAKMPVDFKDFWDKTLADAAKIPLEPVLTPAPDKSTHYSDVYHVRMRGGAGTDLIYGVLSVPKGEGPFPAVVQYPGAGIRSYKGNTLYPQHGVVHFEMGIHGIPIDLSEGVYADLRAGALKNYQTINAADRDTYYYKRVYTACVRALDFITGLEYVDPERVGICGGSQGGALSIVTGALDPRPKFIFANYPALCDIAGYYHGTTGGWPHIYKDRGEAAVEDKVGVSEYYDVVNFARNLRTPILVVMGYNDKVCPPTSTWGAWNSIAGNKELWLFRECAHWLHPHHVVQEQMWLIEKLTSSNPTLRGHTAPNAASNP